MDNKLVEMTRLKKLSKKLELPATQLLKEYKEELERLSNVKGNVERLAVNAVINKYRREMKRQAFTPKATAVPIYGFTTGDTGLRDKAQEMREKIQRVIDKEGLAFARDNQLIDGDNSYLDQRENIYGRTNPKYLTPLDPKLRLQSRTLFGFFKKNGDAKFKYGSIHTEDNKLARAWSKVPFFVPFQTMAIVREETPSEITLSSSSAKETTTIFKAVNEEWDIHKIIMDSIVTMLTPIAEVEQHYETFKDAWDRKIFVKGIASWIGLERPTPWGSIWVGLMDSDLGFEAEQQVRLLVPDHVEIDFGEQSEIVVFGRDRRNYNRNQETGEREPADVIIDVYGIYPIPGLTTPKLSSRPETLEDEEEVEGWLP